ncbi:hypothetical protein [Desulfogranum japonicum]|uniref:hypothetical protein n=1 Tax=Desulfogranum japonicum TaxID=231447 RepID=UPI00041BFA1C|nr:hypothetical protein [Desulfogranum japonicum]
MNNIHEKDWAEDSWAGHTGMDSADDYCVVENSDPIDSQSKQTVDKTAQEAQKHT